ncbi:hypothetical protein MMC07_003458 [Pseudocyphellaria aurata]|nr:hypothetical protein [Pseudocyphellaria aurata]
MVSSTSPLTPRDVNCSTPITNESKTSYNLSESQSCSIFQETENLIQTDDPSASLPVADITSTPIKIRSPRKQHSPQKENENIRPTALTEDALRENEGLTRTIQILEDQCAGSVKDNVENDDISTIGLPQGYPGMDDTGFTTFSAVPNTDMTLFAQLGSSPPKNVLGSPIKAPELMQLNEESYPSQHTGLVTPTSTRRHHFDDCSPSPTPRHPKAEQEDTNLILDFTEQFNAFVSSSNLSPNRRNRISPRKFHTQPDLAFYASDRRTPSPAKRGYRPTTPTNSRQFKNLLDLDLTPAPTPRSVPSISARELESLKSSFLSQISSLRATLSGKEAEVNSLKDAVTDAERRVGEALETVRDERNTKEGLQADKLEWEKRDKEMQSVLRDVKEEIIRGDRERDQLQQKLDDSEYKREEAENRVIDAQSKIAGLEAASGEPIISTTNGTPSSHTAQPNTVEAAVEKVAKELHGLYRHKHEVKVAALKESYKARWERKIRDLETRIEQVSRENEDLRLGRDATMSGLVPGSLPTIPFPRQPVDQEHLDEERVARTQRAKEQAKILASVQEEMKRVRHDNGNLIAQLEKERLEMAALVAATEEMMQLSLQTPASNETVSEPSATSSNENLRGSISRTTSGLRVPSSGAGPGPGPTKSKIGRMGGAGEIKGRGGLGGTGLSSGIMGNIERMGRGRAD